MNRCSRCGHASPVAKAKYCRRCGGVLGRSARSATSVTSPALRFSAAETLTPPQRVLLRLGGVAILLALIANPVGTLVVLIGFVTLLYVAAFTYRVSTFWRAMRGPDEIRIDDDAARGMWDRTLPTYTVLVAAYREPETIGDLVGALERLDYPPDRLDVQLLLEEDDDATYEAVVAAAPPSFVEVVRVPYSEPRTKPKALNYGLSRARGRFVTIYDAEDRPEPLQLRRAVAAFRTVSETVACLQAKLGYYNPHQNIITRLFTVEYAMWFSQLLPGLVTQSAPLPLGGTSNHFRMDVLRRAGGWDPYNVTEDADLGIRLHRLGYRTAVLDSLTLEEANSDFVNWAKQRSRWYKGYMQTWLVHMRDPIALWREVGPRAFFGFHLFVGGTPILALLNPVFWALTVIWFIGRPPLIIELFPAWVYYVGMLCLVFGNLAFIYIGMVSARAARNPRLVLAALATPLYWVMMSIAAIKAVVQLVHAPSFWEKTSHGLDRLKEEPVGERAAV